MAVKSASARKNNPTKKAVEIIVKRGAMRRFHALKRETAEMPVTILWDRRTSERRGVDGKAKAAADRRGVERRKKPAFTWDLADFVVVAPTGRQKAAHRSRTKKS